MPSYLGEALIQPVYRLQRLWIRERKRVWTQPHDVAMLAVQLAVSDIRPSAIDIQHPPPIGESRQYWPRIFVQSMVEIVAEQVSDANHDYRVRPVLQQQRHNRFEHHFHSEALRLSLVIHSY